jgi:hypothetical protein
VFYDEKNHVTQATQTGSLSYTPAFEFTACQADAD